eukprot:scaffold19914_cov61-Phaeocystis_antarctica.AAC.2
MSLALQRPAPRSQSQKPRSFPDPAVSISVLVVVAIPSPTGSVHPPLAAAEAWATTRERSASAGSTPRSRGTAKPSASRYTAMARAPADSVDLAQRRVGVGAGNLLACGGRYITGEKGVALAHGHRSDLPRPARGEVWPPVGVGCPHGARLRPREAFRGAAASEAQGGGLFATLVALQPGVLEAAALCASTCCQVAARPLTRQL